MNAYNRALLLIVFAATLAACGGGSNSAAVGSQASNRAAATVTDSGTGLKASGVCNGNPDAGAVGTAAALVDGDAATYFGAKATLTDRGGLHAGVAVIDCTVTLNFNGSPPSADYAKLAGTVIGSWHDNYGDFYYFEGLHAVANVYALNAAGQKTRLTPETGVDEIDPHCVGETVQDSHQTTCEFAVAAGDATTNLAAGTTAVEFDIEFSTTTSATTCFTTCTNTMEARISGLGVVKSGTDILLTGS